MSHSARRHVPELAIDWILDAPERRWQVLDGTLCFADISGFTALAERLAQRGRMGGEELISRLGSVFADMLDLARDRGGMLLKFGGDALLLFFQGPDHALQAAAAAVAMRQVLREAAATPTSVGPMRLSMSVGLHSGPVHFFLVGSAHRELVLLGPGADGVVATENAATAGEIALSPTTLSLLPKGSSKPRADGLPLLRWRKPAVAPCGARPERPITDALLRQLFPGVLCEFLGPGAPEPEHRVACIAFIRFSGTDALLQREGPDAVARALDETLGRAQECLESEAITLLAVDVDKDGGKLFLGSGVPYAHADDEGNMLRALRRIADLKLPLALQMGINRGHVFAAEVGSGRRGAYSAMGDTTNTAARITGKAPIGQIYAHPSVLDQSMAVFEVTPSPPLTMKGKKVPLVAYQIGQQTGTRRHEGLEVAEFIGREAELALLVERLEALEQGQGGVVCITGDTGMGKSKLIREALARAGKPPLLALRGEPNSATSSYALFREPLQHLLGVDDLPKESRVAALQAFVERAKPTLLPLAPLVGEVAGIVLVPTPESLAIDARFRSARTANVLLELLERAFPGPQAWIVDDAQWCDESSMALLQALADATSDQSWLLLIGRRTGTEGFDPAASSAQESRTTAITLGPLAAPHLSRMLQIATEAAPLRPHEMDLLVTRAGGNPLFALELLRAARDAGSFDAVPESLEAAMAAQVDALDPEARRLLRYASVLGRSFFRQVLAEALRAEGHTMEEATLERLEDFLERDGVDRLRFRSDVICDTTYQAVSYQLRKRLHQRIGETMERLAPDTDAVADALALHFARADDHERAFRYARRNADHAREHFENAEAARFYELALNCARHLPQTSTETYIELLTRLGDVEERAGLLEDSLDAYARALKLAGEDPFVYADLLYSRAAAKERMRAFNGALRDLRAGLKKLANLRSKKVDGLSARLQTATAWVLYGMGRPRQALSHARAAADMARKANERRALGDALMIQDLAELMISGPGPGDSLKQALKIFESLGDLRSEATAKANLGFLCAVAGRWDEAVPWLQSAQEQFSRIGDVVRSTDPAMNLGEILVKQRRYDEAEAVLKDAIRVFNSAHFTEGANLAEMQLARVMIERGDHAEAEAILARVQHEFAIAGQRLYALQTAAMRAFGKWSAGFPAEGIALLNAAEAEAGNEADLVRPVVACERARLAATLGDFDTAAREIETGLIAARAQGLPYEEATLLLLQSTLDEVPGTVDRLQAAKASQEILIRLGVLRQSEGHRF